MLDHCTPPEGAKCASCGQPAYLRLVVMNYPDQELSSTKKSLEAYVKPADPRPFPVTLDLCHFCWRTVGSLVSSNVYRTPDDNVEPWQEWLKPYPPGVWVEQEEGTYRSSWDLRMDEEMKAELSPEEYEEYLEYAATTLYKRKRKKKPPV